MKKKSFWWDFLLEHLSSKKILLLFEVTIKLMIRLQNSTQWSFESFDDLYSHDIFMRRNLFFLMWVIILFIIWYCIYSYCFELINLKNFNFNEQIMIVLVDLRTTLSFLCHFQRNLVRFNSAFIGIDFNRLVIHTILHLF